MSSRARALAKRAAPPPAAPSPHRPNESGTGRTPASSSLRPAAEPDAQLRLGASIRRLRQRNGWSLQRLAREAGISPAAVYKIEKNRMVPSVTVLLKVAKALRHSIDELLAPRDSAELAVTRAASRAEFRFAEFPVALQRLSGKLPDRSLEAGIYLVEPGVACSRDPLTHPGEEVYFVLQGEIRFEVDGQTMLLGEGDALHIKGHLPHRWENAGKTAGRVLFVLTPPPFTGGHEPEAAA